MTLLVTIDPVVATDTETLAKKTKSGKPVAPTTDPNWRELQRHELGAVFHDMSISEFESLKRDIQSNGQLHPIVTYQGKVLDGWHRFRACRDLDIRPRSEPLPTTADPLHYSLASNVERRQSKPSQLTIALVEIWIAQEIAEMSNEEGRSASPLSAALASISSKVKLTKATLAKFAAVSERLVQQARRVVIDGAPEIIAAVKSGTLSLERAVQMVKTPIENQPEALEVHRATAAENQLQKIEKHKARAAQKRQLAESTAFAQGSNKHDTFSDDDSRKHMRHVLGVMGRIDTCMSEVNALAIEVVDLDSPLLTSDVLKAVSEGCEKLRSIAVKLNQRIAPREAAI
jgi:ParB-like chromosome segregation protein Spo0J